MDYRARSHCGNRCHLLAIMNWRKQLTLWWKLLGVTDKAARKKIRVRVGQQFRKKPQRKPKRDKEAEGREAGLRG